MAGRRSVDVLLLVTGEVLELLLRLCLCIWRGAFHAIHPTKTILIIMSAIPILHIHSCDAPEIRHRDRVAWDGRKIILRHRERGSRVRMIRGMLCHSAVQRWARVHALLGLHPKVIGWVTANGDPVIARVHVVGILLTMRTHWMVLGHVGTHGSIHGDVLVVALLVVRIDTVPHVVTSITIVGIGDMMGRVHDLRTAVGMFEQLRKFPSRKVYFSLAIGWILKTEL